ncbi:13091_t:CDS:2 [Cetraspora pellucida]|uniref:13091_t:CDS:1 n=1 Tax=Cetraspora pellucida TaxID=1433469 RepID=A0A9N9CPN9_9GLOM|nr:13091_t:CDS:2 [Cetraspora pellucida]
MTNALINIFKSNYDNSQSEIAENNNNQLPTPSQLLLKITLHFQNININKLSSQEHIKVISEDISNIDNDTSFKVSSSLYVKKELLHCFNLFNKLLNKRNRVFDIRDIIKEYENEIESNCYLLVLNIVILKPGNNPNNTDDVYNAACIYRNDIENDNIYLTADEAIFRHLVSLNETHPGFRFLLGGWHTNCYYYQWSKNDYNSVNDSTNLNTNKRPVSGLDERGS